VQRRKGEHSSNPDPEPKNVAQSEPGFHYLAAANRIYRLSPSFSGALISAFNQVARAGPKQIATPTGIAITPQIDRSPFKKDKSASMTTQGLPPATRM